MISEILSTGKDIVLALAGSGLLAKITIEWYASRKEKVTAVTAPALVAHTNGGNGKGPYASMKDLMDHAVECPKAIHEKIEEYNRRLADKMDQNHKETMEMVTQIKVNLAELKLRRK